jgi:hypothetical protein
MRDLGNRYPGCTLFGSFTTVGTTGAPTALTGNPAPTLVAYKDGASCSTAGITLSRDCNGRTGFNAYAVNLASDAAYYACGHDFELIIHQGTVGGTCVSGYAVAGFSVNNRAALLPQVHGRPLTVSAGGAANINWAGVENCTNVTTLTCTSIYTADHLVQRPVVDSCSTIFSAQRLIDRPVVDSCSTIFSVRKIIDPPVIDSCSVIFSAQRLIDRPIVDASSTITSVSGSVGSVTGNVGGNVAGSVGSVTAAVSIDPCSTVYRLETVSQCVTRTILQSRVIPEPTAVFTFPASVADISAWTGALSSNCITQTASVQSVCNRSVSTTIALAQITCTSTIVSRGTFS